MCGQIGTFSSIKTSIFFDVIFFSVIPRKNHRRKSGTELGFKIELAGTKINQHQKKGDVGWSIFKHKKSFAGNCTRGHKAKPLRHKQSRWGTRGNFTTAVFSEDQNKKLRFEARWSGIRTNRLKKDPRIRPSFPSLSRLCPSSEPLS